MPGARGLDFGCGREPTLSVLFEEAGFPCANYDLHYFNDPAVLNTQYDFLTCSETMEHFRNPREEFEKLLSLVKPGGWIGIMTQLRDDAPKSIAPFSANGVATGTTSPLSSELFMIFLPDKQSDDPLFDKCFYDQLKQFA
jgi:hypothetical protein